jgi:hypothetical protein
MKMNVMNGCFGGRSLKKTNKNKYIKSRKVMKMNVMNGCFGGRRLQ